jgi:hypothetical protein
MNFDKHHLIVQPNGDGGDTAQRTGMYYYLLWVWEQMGLSILGWPLPLPEDFERALRKLEINETGIFIRHPDMWNSPSDFSRDQQTPLIIAMGAYKSYDRLERMFATHTVRFGKYQNFDFSSPESLGFYIRAFRLKWAYPILFIGDLFMLLNSLILCFFHGKDLNFSDDQNHILAILQAIYSMPTPISRAARYLYVKFRPINFGVTKLNEKSPVMGALAWYHNPRHNGIQEFVDLWRPVIEKHFT